MANFEAFRWNFSSSTNPEIGSSMEVKPRNANPRDLQPELELKYIVVEGELNTTQSREFKVNILKTFFISLFDYMQFTW